MRQSWNRSTPGDFDRIDLEHLGYGSEWLTLTMRVGFDVERVSMTLRSDEAVRDLHYALGRYIAQLPSETADLDRLLLQGMIDKHGRG